MMKKILPLCAFLCLICNLAFGQNQHKNTNTLSNWEERNFNTSKSTPIDSADILYWVGEGENYAIMAVIWCEPEIAFAWGYRWNDSAKVVDMMNDIAATDSRFDYDTVGGMITNITYLSEDYDLGIVGNWWMYNVNGSGALEGFQTQKISHGDFIEWGDESCGDVDDDWNYSWDITITPVSVPNGVGIIQYNPNMNISLYPNPANEYITLGINSIKGNNTIIISDIYGRIIRQESFCADGIIQRNITVSDLTQGTYLITLQNGNRMETKKFVIGR